MKDHYNSALILYKTDIYKLNKVRKKKWYFFFKTDEKQVTVNVIGQTCLCWS